MTRLSFFDVDVFGNAGVGDGVVRLERRAPKSSSVRCTVPVERSNIISARSRHICEDETDAEFFITPPPWTTRRGCAIARRVPRTRRPVSATCSRREPNRTNGNQTVRRAMKRVARALDIPIVDLHQYLEFSNGHVDETQFVDGLHRSRAASGRLGASTPSAPPSRSSPDAPATPSSAISRLEALDAVKFPAQITNHHASVARVPDGAVARGANSCNEKCTRARDAFFASALLGRHAQAKATAVVGRRRRRSNQGARRGENRGEKGARTGVSRETSRTVRRGPRGGGDDGCVDERASRRGRRAREGGRRRTTTTTTRRGRNDDVGTRRTRWIVGDGGDGPEDVSSARAPCQTRDDGARRNSNEGGRAWKV